MAAADYRLLTEATGQRIAAALEALSGTGAAATAARTNLDVYSKGETDNAIAQSTAKVKRISFVPPNDLAANSYGYFHVPASEDIKNKTYISTSIALGYPVAARGLQLTGAYTGGDYIYLSYYTQRDISKDDLTMLIDIAYYDTL